MIESYRYVTDTITWEIPAGRIEQGERPTEAASREALEETGYSVTDCVTLYRYHPSNGNSNQVFHVAHARADRQQAAQAFDDNEVREVRWMSQQDIADLIAKGHISDGYSLTGLLLHFSHML
jgi:ADP-ribose pyrophosphatase